MTVIAQDENVLTPKTLNNFLVSMRESTRQARVHLIHHHTRCIKTISKFADKAAGDGDDADASEQANKRSSTLKAKNKKKTLQLRQEIKAVKNFSDEDLGKLVLLNNKTFNQAAREGSNGGQRAICRLAEHAALVKSKQQFADKFGASVKDLPYCIKVLGTKQHYKKVRKMAQHGKKEKFQQTQRFCSQLLRKIGGAEFATAEDLYTKLKKQKLNQKNAKVSKSNKSNSDLPEKSEIAMEVLEEEPEVPEDNERRENDELRSKIFKILDDKCGRLDDSSSDDSDDDFDHKDESSDYMSDSNTEPPPSDTRKLKQISRLKSDANSNPNKKLDKADKNVNSNLSKNSNSSGAADKNVNSNLSKNSNSSGASNITKELHVKSTTNAPSNKEKKTEKINKSVNKLQTTSRNSHDDSNKQSPISAITGVKDYEVKQIDLTKVMLTHTDVPLVSKKRCLEVDVGEQPKGSPSKKTEQQQKKNSETGKQKQSKVSFFHGKEESSDGDDEDVVEQPHSGSGKRSSEGKGHRGRGRGSSSGRGAAHRSFARQENKAEDQRSFSNNRGGKYSRGSYAGSASSSRTSDAEKGSQRGRGAGASGSLHPSWEAKKHQAALSSMATFQGKRTTFN